MSYKMSYYAMGIETETKTVEGMDEVKNFITGHGYPMTCGNTMRDIENTMKLTNWTYELIFPNDYKGIRIEHA